MSGDGMMTTSVGGLRTSSLAAAAAALELKSSKSIE
jgi:hypothetical protein